MGKYDSSKTRVVPVFDHLYKYDETGKKWLPRLLALPNNSSASVSPHLNFSITNRNWGNEEKTLKPPMSLLSWIIRNPRKPVYGNLGKNSNTKDKRQNWIKGSIDQIREGLQLLYDNSNKEDWHIFEGET